MHTKHCKKVFFILFFITFTIFSFSLPAFAAEHFTLTGDYKDSFQLKSNGIHIFGVIDCVPGDYWSSEIEVKNLTGKDMDIAIISIESLLEDTLLFDSFELTLTQGEEILYQGSYGKAGSPVTDYLTVPGNGTLTFDVAVSFPEESSNLYQGRELSSLWTFEAKHPGYYSGSVSFDDEEPDEKDEEESDKPVIPEEEPKEDIVVPGTPVDPVNPPEEPEEDTPDKGIKTGVDLSGSNTASVFLLFLGGFAICIGLIFILKAKSRE